MPASEAPFVPRPSTTALSDGVHRRIEDEIVDGGLAPGTPLREADVAERLGVSRTPVREALRRLAEAGLVRIEANRSYRVAPFDLDHLTETAVVFGSLLGLAGRLALPHLSDFDIEWLATAERRAFGEAAGPQPVAEPLFGIGALDLFVDRCDNAVLVSSMDRLRLHIRRAFRLFGPQVPRLLFAERFGAIVAATRAGDPELLESTLRVHGTQFLLDVIELARQDTERTDLSNPGRQVRQGQ
ncbi:GntR family transcriptional regulator [Cellulomonas chitinilytica]|uniref:GntR family transcriptional regulator n=1 Tax=Cellulomonas chitinilytica TaxID=398759 RepID=A0A919NZJ4_9CELL|nr:GntR family transcriptional regulator [Cellulomonas chitinilytica]GIG20576.1 GntR family transcriptional regulator [Cellulomonas chitinilytica]